MKELKGFEQAKVMSGESTQLPKGGYIAKILSCEEVTGNKNGRDYSYLAFAFDIAEGDYKDHYANIYRASNDENKKWRGNYNEFLPDETSQYYEQNLSKFKTMVANFEDSNNGYHWDWNEAGLKGKYIGIVYREKEFKTSDGDIITITEPYGFRSVEAIKNGKFKVPAFKKLKEETSSTDFSSFEPIGDNDDIPF